MTNKVVLRTVEEFMNDYTPVYQPIYPLLLGKSQSYSKDAGKVNFNRIDTIGDIRAKHLTPKDTELHQVNAREGSKTFKKYFLANQYIQSALQDRSGVEEVNAQVLDEHQKQFDELTLLGEGTSTSTMINNGLFWSNDPNYTLEGSEEIDTDADPLIGLHSQVMVNVAKADLVAGKKLILFYGENVLAKYDSLYSAQPVAFKKALAEVLGPNYSFAKIPAPITPSSTDGLIIVNLDKVKLHYTALPSLVDQGVNAEKMYSWANFLMGSSMLEVLAQHAVVRQPITFEA